ncbi:hypothetical protein ACES2L_13460 [Bdellovibrio bacteriovorus]
MSGLTTISLRLVLLGALTATVACGDMQGRLNTEIDSNDLASTSSIRTVEMVTQEDADELDELINNLLYKEAVASVIDFHAETVEKNKEEKEQAANKPEVKPEPKTEVPKAPEPKKEEVKPVVKEDPKKEEPKTAPGPQVKPNEGAGSIGGIASAVQKTPPKEDFEGPGKLKPTIYYFVVINEDKSSKCDEKMGLHGQGGKKLLTVCKRTHKACALQGSCGVIQNGRMHYFNIIGRFQNQERFFEIGKEGCRYGYGVNSSCLDPFYTLAADLSIYKPGEVIFIPSVVGLELPDGSKHSGYFIIRDKGRGIIGRGRFDFYSGEYHWNDKKNNSLAKIGFADVTTNVPYYRVKGETAKTVLASRDFPRLPVNAIGSDK